MVFQKFFKVCFHVFFWLLSLSKEDCVLDHQNGANSDLYVLLDRNFVFLQSENLPISESQKAKFERVFERLEACGTKLEEFVDLENSSIVNFPMHCDNRVCDNPDCKEHRLYKFMRNHSSQIDILNESMRKPKAWVFTGWNLPAPVDRSFCQEQLLKIVRLLRDPLHGSVSEFSVHMELKPHSDGSFYLHFHVVCAGIRDLRFVRAVYGRVIRFEEAIRPSDLGYYVSKYASKVPCFNFEGAMVHYLIVCYKLQMHRFSCCKQQEGIDARYVLMDRLRREVYNAVKRESLSSSAFLGFRESYVHDFVPKVNCGDRNKQTRLFDYDS